MFMPNLLLQYTEQSLAAYMFRCILYTLIGLLWSIITQFNTLNNMPFVTYL